MRDAAVPTAAAAAPPAPPRIRNLVSAQGGYRVLHLAMLAFLLSFMVWFGMAPFLGAIKADLGLTDAQIGVLVLCNLALTIPARMVIGILVDRFGPRRLYAGLLIFAAIPNTVFALADSYPMLVVSRLLVGIVGAGFVVGIRLVAEWISGPELGTAEGYYAGWGNFGSAAAALTLPTLAYVIADGPGAWRWGVGIAGLVAAVYGVIFYALVRDTPEGRTYLRPKSKGALEVTSRRAVAGLVLLQVPLVLALDFVAYRLYLGGLFPVFGLFVVFMVLAGLMAYQFRAVLRTNASVMRGEPATTERYPFVAVVLLCLIYAVTFGAELAMVGLLPRFFGQTYHLSVAAAAAAGSAFAFTNLLARPGGGFLADRMHDRRGLLTVLLGCSVLACLVLTTMSADWPLWLAMALVAVAALFLQACNGAVFAMVPLISRRNGGQIAGLVGAFGNVGGIALSALTVFGLGVPVVFMAIGIAAVAIAVLVRWLPQLEGGHEAHAEEPLVGFPELAVA